MTFPEQVKNVPPELVAQGWRREPSHEVLDVWTGVYRQHQRWETILVRDINNESLLVYRPVEPIAGTRLAWDNGCSIYAHQGWGDGLAPTPEMCEVWSYWWVAGTGLDPAGTLEPYHHTTLLWDTVSLQGRWLGPVLPPVGVV